LCRLGTSRWDRSRCWSSSVVRFGGGRRRLGGWLSSSTHRFRIECVICVSLGMTMKLWTVHALCLILHGTVLFQWSTRINLCRISDPGRDPVCKLDLLVLTKGVALEQGFSCLVNMGPLPLNLARKQVIYWICSFSFVNQCYCLFGGYLIDLSCQ